MSDGNHVRPIDRFLSFRSTLLATARKEGEYSPPKKARCSDKARYTSSPSKDDSGLFEFLVPNFVFQPQDNLNSKSINLRTLEASEKINNNTSREGSQSLAPCTYNIQAIFFSGGYRGHFPIGSLKKKALTSFVECLELSRRIFLHAGKQNYGNGRYECLLRA